MKHDTTETAFLFLRAIEKESVISDTLLHPHHVAIIFIKSVLVLLVIKYIFEVITMSLIEDSIKNLEIALAELKAALQAEQLITNQAELTNEQLLELSSIRF